MCESEGIVPIGLALGVLELPGLGRRVGNAELNAKIVHPAAQSAGLDDHDAGLMPLDHFNQLGRMVVTLSNWAWLEIRS